MRMNLIEDEMRNETFENDSTNDDSTNDNSTNDNSANSDVIDNLNGNNHEINDNHEDDDSETGNFTGFVLLNEAEWDRAQFIQDLKNDWGIDISSELETEEEYLDIIVAFFEGISLAVSFLDMPVPNGEAEYYAEANYMWKEAVEVTRTHKAQIIVAVLGGEKGANEKAVLFVKAVASCLKQKHAVAVYTDGAVYEPEYYRKFSEMINDSEMPVFNLIWFGLYRDKNQAGIYTYGMKKFGKQELEIYVPVEKADLAELYDFTADIVAYILENDVTLRDGETIGFSENQKLPITCSDGVALEGKTLKIGYIKSCLMPI